MGDEGGQNSGNGHLCELLWKGKFNFQYIFTMEFTSFHGFPVIQTRKKHLT